MTTMQLVELENDWEAQYDDWAADQYERRFDDAIAAAWRTAEPVGTMERSAYYDTTTLRLRVPTDADARAVGAALRRTIFGRVGHDMAAYGKFGGYSSLGRVRDVEPGVVTAESVYHIGD